MPMIRSILRAALSKRRFLLLFAFLPATPVLVFGQASNTTLTGIVSDSGGASIVGATVQVKNAGTNAVETATTNSSGTYTVSQLVPGSYDVTTTKTGFQTSVETGITLTVGEAGTLNIALKVGKLSQTVTVSGSAELINTSNGEISEVVNKHEIEQLPLNGRDPSSLVLLTTGTTNVLNSAVGVLQTETTFPTSTGASAGGGRQGSTYYLLDGAPNMDTYTLLDAPFPNADATQEFRVISNSFDSRYGYSPDAIVTIQTKSGTNDFHGGAFDFLRNNDLNAANYFSHVVDTLKRNQFGGFLGGPIIRNKLFFFGNYQGTRATQAAGTNSTYTPTAAMLAGDFTAVPKPAATAADPDPCPICGTTVDPAGFNAAAVKIATTALPLGQGPTGLINFGGPANKQHFDEGTARLDLNLNQKQHLFVRSFVNYYLQVGGALKGNIVGNAVVTSKPGRYINEVVGHDWAINPTTANNVTLFWTEEHVTNGQEGLDTGGNPVCLSEYINVNEPAGDCYLEGLSVTNGFTTNYNEPTGENRTTYGFSEGLSKQIGNHSLSFGGNLWRQFAQENTLYPSVPIVNFSGAFTGFGLADFLYGDVNTYYQGAGEIASVKGYQFGLYAQDQYKFRPNLTITAGVRWDPNTPPASTGGRGAAFRAGQQSTVYPNAPLGLIFPGDHGLDSALQPTTYGYVEPRIGFSWQPAALPHTVVRGGFGLFTSPLPYSAYNHSADIAPFSPTFQLTAAQPAVPGTLATSNINFSNPWASTPSGVSPFPPFASLSYKPPSTSTFQTPVDLPASFSPNFRLGTTQSWNLSVDQQFTQNLALHVSYVASESYHLAQVLDLNPGYYGSPTNGGRPTYLNYSQVLEDDSFGTSPYHSLQVAVEERLSHGLEAHSSFTWSKTIDVASTGNISFSNGIADPFDIRHNRGNSDLNFPLISVTNVVYTTPGLTNRNLLERNLLGGWEVSGIFTLQSGEPFSIVGGAGNNQSGADQYGDRADVVPGQAPDPHSGSKQHWLQNYINPAAFQENAPGTFGDSGRNIFTAPRVVTADMSFDKTWEVRERYALQFRWEMFNAFNHTTFGEPQTDPTSSNFGQITGIANGTAPRVQQAALKLTF
jgi:hypothetical protein